jgi:putative sterol carrier protein
MSAHPQASKKLKALLFIVVFYVPGSSTIVGQPKPTIDSTQVEASTVNMYEGLFGKEWSEKFAEQWNGAKDTTKGLAEMGKVYFVSVGKETTSALMEFDSLGRGRLVKVSASFPEDSVPIFSSSLEKWASFMEGRFKAIPGVLTRKIIFKGSMMTGIKYGLAFDKVAPIGKRVSQWLNQRRKR